jgi:HSP20 family protein
MHPHTSKDDVSIDVHQNTLSLRGQRKHETEVKDEHYYRVERSYGSFQRSFTLPGTVDAEKAEASFKDGVLELRLPRLESAKPRQIAIQS